MKKLISLMLALIMVLSLATVASAEEVTYAPTDGNHSVTINKTFNSDSIGVTDTLKFTSECIKKPDNSTAPTVTISEVAVNGATTATINVVFGAFSTAGEYQFKIKETAGNVVGMDYTEQEYIINVLVGYDNGETKKLTIEGTSAYIVDTSEEDGKADAFVNTFTHGSFTVEKKVTGNMANKNDTFQIKVTLDAGSKVFGTAIKEAGVKNDDMIGQSKYEKTLTLSEAAGQYTFSEIPTGVTVTVVELNGENTVSANGDAGNGYKLVSITGSGLTVAEVAEDATVPAIVVTNDKTAEVATGIVTDSAPYIILIAVCAVAAVAFVLKRRNAVEY